MNTTNTRRIATATAIVALTLLTGALTTFAAWTDSVTVTNNVVQTGTADLEVSNNSGASWDTATVSTANVISNLVPGVAATDGGYSFSLWNNSTAGATFDLTGQVTASSVAPTAGVDKTQLMLQLYDTDTNGDESAEMTLADWEAGTQALTTSLTSGSTKNYGFRARLLGTALNEWQGQTVTYTLTVTGTTQ